MPVPVLAAEQTGCASAAAPSLAGPPGSPHTPAATNDDSAIGYRDLPYDSASGFRDMAVHARHV